MFCSGVCIELTTVNRLRSYRIFLNIRVSILKYGYSEGGKGIRDESRTSLEDNRTPCLCSDTLVF